MRCHLMWYTLSVLLQPCNLTWIETTSTTKFKKYHFDDLGVINHIIIDDVLVVIKVVDTFSGACFVETELLTRTELWHRPPSATSMDTNGQHLYGPLYHQIQHWFLSKCTGNRFTRHNSWYVLLFESNATIPASYNRKSTILWLSVQKTMQQLLFLLLLLN